MLPVVVTRPEDTGRRLTAELAAAGFDALWLPAFDLGPAPDPRAVEQALARLSHYDLTIFVSPAAARATAAALPSAWPGGTTIATVGAATERAVRDHIAGADAATILSASGDDAESGSEALWAVLQAQPWSPQRVLILRAQGGREWLLQQLRGAGAAVEALAVYSRTPHAVGAADLDWLAGRSRSGALASVMTSSEVVDALAAQVAGQPASWAALRAGPALASHPRIVARLRAAGFADVRLCAPRAEAIVPLLHAAGTAQPCG